MREKKEIKQTKEREMELTEKEQAAWKQGAVDRLHNDAWAWKTYKRCKAIMDKNAQAKAYVKGFESSGTGE